MISASIIQRTKPQDGGEIEYIDRLVWAYKYMLSRSKARTGDPSIPRGVRDSAASQRRQLVQTSLEGDLRWSR